MNSPAPLTKPTSSRSGQSRSTPAERSTSSKGRRRAGRRRRERSRSLTARARLPNRSGARPTRQSPNASAIEGAAKGPLPGFVEPMLATLTKSPPTGDRWLHEIKFDGYRLQAHIEDGKVTLWTRGGLDWTHKFGDAVPAGAARSAGPNGLDRRRAGGRKRERRRRVFAFASGPQRRTPRPVRLLRLRLPLSRRIRFARSARSSAARSC